MNTQHRALPWHVTIWTPHTDIGEVAGLMDENGIQQALILAGPDGLTSTQIERAQFIIRAANNFYPLLEALEDIRRTAKTDPTNLPVKMFAGDIAARATAAIERAKEGK